MDGSVDRGERTKHQLSHENGRTDDFCAVSVPD